MWALGEEERLLCPEEFQERLTQAGGINKYDEPNFKMAWGQTETFRAGGVWEVEDCPPYTGYRDLLIGSGEACWMLMMWEPADMEGTPEGFYVKNFDPDTGLQTLGEFPYSGQYIIVQPLVWKGMVNGELIIERMPLNSLLLDLVIPTILDAQDVSLVKRKAVFMEIKAREDERMTKDIADSLAKGRLAFGTSDVSYAGQASKTMFIQKKVDNLKRNMNSAMEMARHLNKGLVQG